MISCPADPAIGPTIEKKHKAKTQAKRQTKHHRLTSRITLISRIYISRLCYDVSVRLSVCPSVCDGSALAHYS